MAARPAALRLKAFIPASLLLVPVALLAAATCYELIYAFGGIAFGGIAPGDLPGRGPDGEETAVLAGLLGMLIGISLCGVLAALDLRGGLFAPLLAPLAAVFVIARQYTFDPYYFPSHRRIADGAVFSEAWLAGFLLVALVVAWLTRTSPQLGCVLTGGVLLVGILITLLQNASH